MAISKVFLYVLNIFGKKSKLFLQSLLRKKKSKRITYFKMPYFKMKAF